MQWLGLDVGGANLKLADGRGFAVSRYYPLWQQPAGLAAAVAALLEEVPGDRGLAVTMTGELADCYATKREGVSAILDAVTAAAATRRVRVYSTSVGDSLRESQGTARGASGPHSTAGRFMETDEARERYLLVAAANWHALASYAGQFARRQTALLIDVGSTTSDLIPLVDGQPVAAGHSDPKRLLAGELVYTGIQRTPVCAVVAEVPWGGAMCPTAGEVFATTWDAYLTLGDLPEEPGDTYTADGRPATRSAAHDRLARAICADRDMFSASDALAAAQAIREAQLLKLRHAAAKVIGRLPQPPQTAILSGSGEFLARQLAESLCIENAISLSDRLGAGPSRCAAAHAVAVLANEHLG